MVFMLEISRSKHRELPLFKRLLFYISLRLIHRRSYPCVPFLPSALCIYLHFLLLLLLCVCLGFLPQEAGVPEGRKRLNVTNSVSFKCLLYVLVSVQVNLQSRQQVSLNKYEEGLLTAYHTCWLS